MRNGEGIGAGLTHPIGEGHEAISQSSWCVQGHVGHVIQQPMAQYQHQERTVDQRKQKTENELKVREAGKSSNLYRDLKMKSTSHINDQLVDHFKF